MRRLLSLAVLTGLLAACQDGMPTQPDGTAAASLGAGPNDDVYIVVLRGPVADVPREAGRLSAAHGGDLQRTYEAALKGFAVRMSDAQANAMARESDVLIVEKDQPVSIVTTQTNATWGLDRIDQRNLPLSTTYTYNATGAGVTVYVIDTGIRTSHVDFGGRAAASFTAINDGNGANDCNGHGTHVSGTIGGSTWGVAKGVALRAVRVLDCTGSGTVSGVIAGIDWVTAHAVRPAVANMSLGGGASSAMDAAVANSIASGVVYAVSAGNDALSACTQSPSRAPAAITVGATSKTDRRASFSNYGSCLDIFAPGVAVTSAYNSSNTATASLSGTSMASPHVAGAAALYLEGDPNATPAKVTQALTSNATSGKLSNVGPGSPNLLLYTGFITGGGGGGGGSTVNLDVIGGDDQSGDVGTILPKKLIVYVSDANGSPIGGAPITWTVKSGGGTLVDSDARTGAKGRATATLQLGPTSGTQTVEASTPGAPAVTFTATAIGVSPSLSLQIWSGNNQTGEVGTELPQQLFVYVSDSNGAAVAGAPITWTVTSGGGSITQSDAQTGSGGLAGATFLLGPTAGTQTVEASTPGTTPVTFTATATNPPSQPTLTLQIVSGDNQTAPAGTTLPGALLVYLSDSNGNPVGGAAITWTVRSGGGVLAQHDLKTGIKGKAEASLTLGPVPGTNTVEVSVAGANPVTFTATGN